MKKILVVNVNWMGDVIFSSPVFAALKAQYPQAHIACLAPIRVKPILDCIDAVDHVMGYDERVEQRSLWRRWKVLRQVRREKFDAVFLLHRSYSRALFVYLAGIPIRVGYATKKRTRLLTHAVALDTQACHRSDHYLRVLEDFGVPVVDRQTRLTVAVADERWAQKMLVRCGLKQEAKFVVINPGGNWDLKRWPVSSFACLLGLLMKDPSLNIVMAGAPKDQELVEVMTRALPRQPIVLTGQTTLGQAMAVMRQATCVVSGDSGPLHLANAVGAPVVALFGPTRPEITAPRGPGKVTLLQHDVGCNRQACYHLSCLDNTCMKSLTAQEVVEAIKQYS